MIHFVLFISVHPHSHIYVIPAVSSTTHPSTTYSFIVIEATTEVERQDIGTRAVVVHGRPVGDPWGHVGHGEETEVISIEEIRISLLAALGVLGEWLWFSAAPLAVEVIIIEEVEGANVADGADGRRELPHHVPDRPNDGSWGRAEQLHGGRTVEEEVAVVRIRQDRRSSHAEKNHNRLKEDMDWMALGRKQTRMRNKKFNKKTQ